MAVLTDAQVGVFFDEKWDLEVNQALYGEAVSMPRILNKSSLVNGSGEIIHITTRPRLVGGDVGSDGGFTSEQTTFTEVQVNVNTWKYVSQEYTDKQSKQSIVSLEKELPSQFGERLAEFYDSDINDLILSATGLDGVTVGAGIGSPGAPLSFIEPNALAAVLAIRRRSIKIENLSWLLSPECYYLGWLTKERMTNADKTGLPESVLTTNFRQKILNIPGYESGLLNGTSCTDDSGASLNPASGINVAGTTACGLVHSDFAAIAMQFNNKYKKADATSAGRLATIIVAHTLYGLVVNRAKFAVPLYISNT